MANINVTVADGQVIRVDVGENTLAAANSATLSQAWAENAAADAAVSQQARDVAIAAGTQYPSDAAAVAALADGAFGSYLDTNGLPVYGQRVGSAMVPIPGPWFEAERIGLGGGTVVDLIGSGGADIIGAAGGGTVQDDINARVPSLSPMQFGAVGDGVANDSAAFALVETRPQKAVDLEGRTYALTSIWADPAAGVFLAKDYRNGTILMDGRPYIQDAAEGFARSGSASPRLPTPQTTKRLGIFRDNENLYFIWRPLGGQYWQRSRLSRTANTVPLNWDEIFIRQVFGYTAARDPGVVYTGSWSALSSGAANTYVSGRAEQAFAVGDFAEISYTGSGDLYVVFSGRTNGNFVNVLIDGSTARVTLPDDGSGNRFLDSYTPVDLTHRQRVKIAENLPQGTYTIRLTMSASRNASASGLPRFVFNALAFDHPEIGPWIPATDAPIWSAGQTILQNQVRKFGRNYYFATGNGTTGATPPTHTTGTSSDGGVNWTYRADSGYNLVDHRIQAAGSQLEYAYEIKPTGATNKEDVGGALHGNETQTSLAFLVDGNSISIADNEWRIGENVTIREGITATHSQIDGGATPVALTSLRRTFSREFIEIAHRHVLQMAAELGYFYNAMWPLLHYSNVGWKYGVTNIWSPSDGSRRPADFYNQSNPFVGRTKDLVFVCTGPALQLDGAAGVPTTSPAPLEFVAWLTTDSESVDGYRNSNRIFAGKAMNTSGANVSAGGFSSMTSKLYFERYSAQAPTALPSGQVIDCVARYGLALRAPQ